MSNIAIISESKAPAVDDLRRGLQATCAVTSTVTVLNADDVPLDEATKNAIQDHARYRGQLDPSLLHEIGTMLEQDPSRY